MLGRLLMEIRVDIIELSRFPNKSPQTETDDSTLQEAADNTIVSERDSGLDVLSPSRQSTPILNSPARGRLAAKTFNQDRPRSLTPARNAQFTPTPGRKNSLTDIKSYFNNAESPKRKALSTPEEKKNPKQQKSDELIS